MKSSQIPLPKTYISCIVPRSFDRDNTHHIIIFYKFTYFKVRHYLTLAAIFLFELTFCNIHTSIKLKAALKKPNKLLI